MAFITFQPLAFVAIALALLILIFDAIRHRSRIRKFAQQNGCESPTAPYSQKFLLFGLDYVYHHAMNIRQHHFAEGILALFNRYGPTWTATVLGNYVIHTIDPENLRALMATNHDDYGVIPPRKKLVETLFGKGIFANSGHEWSQSRNLIRKTMGAMTYDENVYMRHSEELVQSLLASGAKGSNFYDQALRYTADLASDLYFGESSKSIDQEKSERSYELFTNFTGVGKMARALTFFGPRIPVAAHFFFRSDQPSKQSVHTIIDDYLRETQELRNSAEKSPATQERTTLTQAFVKVTDDLPRARAEILNLILAGNETVAIGLSELLWNLARHPDVWIKLRSEVDSVLQGRKPALNDFSKLGYMKMVINESLRLRPTLSVHGRYSLNDTVLPRGGGKNGSDPIFVPAKSYVIYSNYALHRDPSVFGPDIEAFRPERWAGVKDPGSAAPPEGYQPLKPERYEFLSFLAGPRGCPGEKLGTTMVAYALVRLLQEFEFVQPRDDRPWEEAMSFSFFNRNGVSIAFIPVESKS